MQTDTRAGNGNGTFSVAKPNRAMRREAFAQGKKDRIRKWNQQTAFISILLDEGAKVVAAPVGEYVRIAGRRFLRRDLERVQKMRFIERNRGRRARLAAEKGMEPREHKPTPLQRAVNKTKRLFGKMSGRFGRVRKMPNKGRH